MRRFALAGALALAALLAGPAPAHASLDLDRAPPLAAAKHWIGIRYHGGVGEFFDRRTGRHFVPRGPNYLKLDHRPGQDPFDLLLDPLTWDPAAIRADLATMRALGYNTIRVFLDLCRFECIGDSKQINPKLLDDLAALLRMARARGIVVLLTVNEIDAFFSYKADLPQCCELYDGSFNALYLSPEGLRAARSFYTDVIKGLEKRKAPLEAVLAYELRNEQFFNAQLPPLSLGTGSITTANGKTYDLSDQGSRERMLDEGLLFWIDRLRKAIKALDPTALVTMGFFPPSADPDNRLVRTREVIARSSLDFFDIHVYPFLSPEPLWSQVIQEFGLEGYDHKPVILGEFGSFRDRHPTARLGALALTDWQVRSCAYGIDGWLQWLWGPADPELWTGVDDGGRINRWLSPKERPDPCVYGGPYEPDLALGRPATASASFPEFGPERAVDGRGTTEWSAGGPPPQWIEIDLGRPSTITELDLMVFQLTAGDTVHRVIGRREDGSQETLAEFAGFTQDGGWLVASPPTPWEGVRYVRVETASGPSWVAWREIVVLGHDSG
jgi:hypothetical protein